MIATLPTQIHFVIDDNGDFGGSEGSSNRSPPQLYVRLSCLGPLRQWSVIEPVRYVTDLRAYIVIAIQNFILKKNKLKNIILIYEFYKYLKST